MKKRFDFVIWIFRFKYLMTKGISYEKFLRLGYSYLVNESDRDLWQFIDDNEYSESMIVLKQRMRYLTKKFFILDLFIQAVDWNVIQEKIRGDNESSECPGVTNKISYFLIHLPCMFLLCQWIRFCTICCDEDIESKDYPEAADEINFLNLGSSYSDSKSFCREFLDNNEDIESKDYPEAADEINFLILGLLTLTANHFIENS